MSYPQRNYEQQGPPRDYYQAPQSQDYRREVRPQYDSRREFDPRDQRDQRDYGREVRYDDRRAGASPMAPAYGEREREFKRGRYDVSSYSLF